MSRTPQARVPAPPLHGGLAWLNTEQPLDIHELRGKVVLLDFWTYCCVNCMHVLPDLKYLEEKYPESLAVIGVHSAKFTTEAEVESVREAVLRWEIEHPVVVDDRMAIWKRYGVQAWPTVWVIDPEGFLVGQVPGEGHRALLDQAVGELTQEAEVTLSLDRTPLPMKLERDAVRAQALHYPGKVLATDDGRLFVADTNHNRIVLARHDGTVERVVGTGHVGMTDGEFEEATFNHPQGMALDGDRLYVADTENHAIRRIDLTARTVTTVAGSGRIATMPGMTGTGSGVDLNSPWDIEVVGRELFIAMAGNHQIWRMNLDTRYVERHSGSMREDVLDGGHDAAAFAQPSGITHFDNRLYVADSETSAIRAVDVGAGGRVETLVGKGLFDYGDVDGTGSRVRLQHPLGVLAVGDELVIADTFNHKIKVMDVARREVHSVLGSGRPGLRDGARDAAAFAEPGGVSVAAGKLFIADTNNHRVRVADLATFEVVTLDLRGLTPPHTRVEVVHPIGTHEPEEEDAIDVDLPFLGPDVQHRSLPLARVSPGSANVWQIRFDLPDGCHVNEDAPLTYRVWTEGDGASPERAGETRQVKGSALPLVLSLKAPKDAGATKLHLAASVPYCADSGGMCFTKSVVATGEVEIAEGASDWLAWAVQIEA